jgi:hypothetical protein
MIVIPAKARLGARLSEARAGIQFFLDTFRMTGHRFSPVRRLLTRSSLSEVIWSLACLPACR